MKLDIDPRLPNGTDVARLVSRLYELLRRMAQANNAHSDGYVHAAQVLAGNYTQQAGDSILLVSAAGGARAITLQSAADAVGKLTTVRKTEGSANAVTLTPGSGLIDGAATLALTAAAPKCQLVSDGTNFFTV